MSIYSSIPVASSTPADTKIYDYLSNFALSDSTTFLSDSISSLDYINIGNLKIPKFVNEYWTSKQRQGNSIHEISYRACFKPQLPRFFIDLLTEPGDIVFDPFSGRGTTPLEAGIMKRNVISNDINPLSEILTSPRFHIPDIDEVAVRLDGIKFDYDLKADIDLSMFYHPKTESEIVSLRNYLIGKNNSSFVKGGRGVVNNEDYIDKWIRMIATNRLTGHSKNFFSVYTLPPNQAIGQEKQRKINELRNQSPVYKDIKEIILLKTKQLLFDINKGLKSQLKEIFEKAIFLNKDARDVSEIETDSVSLTVTSPPFLNIVQYDEDNWLRCWFNNIDLNSVTPKITMLRKVEDWCSFMQEVFFELFRITKPNGWVAFEVGEVNNGKINLDEHIVPVGINAGFSCISVLINNQNFTKTSNIWGIKNNNKGTNSNRIVLFKKFQ